MMTTAPTWYDDPEEVVAFARWYFEGARAYAHEVIDLFDKPWKWDSEYEAFTQITSPYGEL